MNAAFDPDSILCARQSTMNRELLRHGKKPSSLTELTPNERKHIYINAYIEDTLNGRIQKGQEPTQEQLVGSPWKIEEARFPQCISLR